MTTQSGSIATSPGRQLVAPSPSLLDGYRFRVCDTVEDAARAVAVRREVYVRGAGYDIAVPDEFDTRSWLLLAEEEATGAAVGTMRITPRRFGSYECERYFDIPVSHRTRICGEINRFAILPAHRRAGSGMPAVSLGLVKLVIHFMAGVAGLPRGVVASRPERSFTYEWIGFRSTGQRAPYGSLGAVPHELLVVDFRDDIETAMATHPLGSFLLDEPSPEITLPRQVPVLGLAALELTPLRTAVGA